MRLKVVKTLKKWSVNFFASVHFVQPAIETVVIDLVPSHARQILQRGARIPTLGHFQVRWAARRTARR